MLHIILHALHASDQDVLVHKNMKPRCNQQNIVHLVIVSQFTTMTVSVTRELWF